MTETFTFQADPLAAAVRAIVAAAGSHDGEAAQVAANLVEANLRGHDSHGVGMVPRYVDAVLEGGLAVNAHVAIRQDSGALLTLDGRQGYGQVIGQEAMELGAARAKEHGRLRRRPGAFASPGPDRPVGRAMRRPRPGLDPLRQRAVAADRRAVRRPRRPPGHQPVLRRHPASGGRADPARLRDQQDRARQDARRLQQGRRDRAGHADRRPRRADDRIRATPSSSRSARCCRSASTRAPAWR